jgi:ethanolamine utilization protein EutP (predicted NTPase)
MGKEQEQYETVVDKDSLNRSLVAEDGTIACQCDGTSLSVRQCLANITKWDLPSDESEQNHKRTVNECGREGLIRISKLLTSGSLREQNK